MEAAEDHKPGATARLAQRPRVLYSCGVSALTVASKAYHRVEDLHGPLGALAKKLSSWASPVLRPLQHRWLSLLSFADGYVLTIEDVIVSVFPSAAHLLDVLDKLALLSEAAPKKFDDAADQLPAMLCRAPLVGWVAAELGEGWKLLASMFEHGGGGSEERKIGVDTACDEHPAVAGSAEEGGPAVLPQEESREATTPDGEKIECEEAGEMEEKPQNSGAVEEEAVELREEVTAKKPAEEGGKESQQPQSLTCWHMEAKSFHPSSSSAATLPTRGARRSLAGSEEREIGVDIACDEHPAAVGLAEEAGPAVLPQEESREAAAPDSEKIECEEAGAMAEKPQNSRAVEEEAMELGEEVTAKKPGEEGGEESPQPQSPSCSHMEARSFHPSPSSVATQPTRGARRSMAGSEEREIGFDIACAVELGEEVRAKQPAEEGGEESPQPQSELVRVKDPIMKLFDQGWAMR